MLHYTESVSDIDLALFRDHGILLVTGKKKKKKGNPKSNNDVSVFSISLFKFLGIWVRGATDAKLVGKMELRKGYFSTARSFRQFILNFLTEGPLLRS